MTSKFLQKLKELELKHYAVIAVFCIVFTGVVVGIITYRQSNLGPELEITAPSESGRTYYSEYIIVEGDTAPGAKITVFDAEAVADQNGYFVIEVPLSEGENQIEVTAEIDGKKSNKEITAVRGNLENTPIVSEPEELPKKVAEGEVTEYDNLNSSGPETFWAGELALISGAGLLWQTSKKKLRDKLLK